MTQKTAPGASGSPARSRGEFAYLASLRRRLGGRARPGELHLGDDTAVLLPPKGRLLLATDVVVEGVHFDLSFCRAADVGWKAMAVNVSDVAAMGGIATHAVATVSGPPGTDLDGLFEGLEAAGSAYGVALVGGDLSGGDRLVVSVAIVGETGALDAVTRAGASAGDELWCTGPLGGSAAGLAYLSMTGRPPTADVGVSATGEPPAADLGVGDEVRQACIEAYLRPRARPAEGRLAAELGASAMIDVSDGLSSDLVHLAEESGVGVLVETVPTAPGATELQALGGGEDYELVFAIRPGTKVAEAFEAARLRVPIRIGKALDDPSLRLLGDRPLPEAGFVHEIG